MNYIVIFGVFLLLSLGVYTLFGPNGATPTDIGISDGQLWPLRDTPNGIASVTSNPNKRVPPLPLLGSVDQSFDVITAAAQSFGKVTVVTRNANYLHLMFTTPLMGFHDDVEWLVNDQGSIDVRSQSRTGKGDMGLNRARFEHIQAFYTAALKTATPPAVTGAPQ